MTEDTQQKGIMAGNVRSVSIGEMIVSAAPNDVLVAFGIGSCVAICLYDPVARVGGMLHALLPAASNGNLTGGNPVKFVDQGTPLLIQSLLELGSRRTRLVAQLYGGAQALSALAGLDDDDWLNIGKRNVQAAEDALCATGLWIQARATGGRIGRTARLYIADGRVTVRSLGRDVQVMVLVPDVKPKARNIATQYGTGDSLWPK